MQVTSEGSVRVDLVGGTLDLEPINLILPNVVTVNLATSLKAKVVLEELDSDDLIIKSLDYSKEYNYKLQDLTPENLFYSDFFKEMSFICQVIDLFKLEKGILVTLSSGSPAGAGLGGSSSMGATLYKALAELTGQDFEKHSAVKMVKSCEARILNQGVPGYQDYYPALTGGVLALRGNASGIELEQLFDPELKSLLEEHLTLVYSGISRDSGINNWQVYKDFFDQKNDVRRKMGDIAEVSYNCYLAIKNNEFEKVLKYIVQEGELRKALAPGIVPGEIESLLGELKNVNSSIGIKMCGAGGGGCFLIVHPSELKSQVEELVLSHKMKLLDFEIERPLV